MTFGSLFSGIGGMDLGLEWAGMECKWQVERDGFCQKILNRRWPGVTRYDDVREFYGRTRGEGGKHSVPKGNGSYPQGNSVRLEPGADRVDLLVGGFPCQDLSVAGRRSGLCGERSGLFFEIIRIAKEIKPTWGLLENVPGLFSSHGGRDMATVLERLRECWPVVGYRVLDSQYFGVPQRRRRVFFVCGPTAHSVEEILFEPEGRGGHSSPGDQAWSSLAATLRSRSAKPGISQPGRGGEDDMNLILSDTLGASADRITGRQGPIAPLLSGHSHYGDQIGYESHLTIAATLNSGGNNGGFRTEPGEHLVAHTLQGEGFDASEDGTGRGTPMVVSGRERGDDGRGYKREPHISNLPALDATKPDRLFNDLGVRRLTPTECERLQGFPDGWTCLCQDIQKYDPMKCVCPDSPRYRAIGNAVTVKVLRWFGMRIFYFDKEFP